MNDVKFSSRKFMLTLFVTLSAYPMRIFDYIDSTTFLSLVGGVLALYFTGNVAEKFVLK